MSNNFMDNYVDVAERIRLLKERYPEASLQPADPSRPFWIEDVPNIGPRLIYVAACYRHPTDPRPGIGMAWEPIPGLTPYTKGSELMVAETSAWGRAIVAALAADSQKVASADEVRNRQEQPKPQQQAKSQQHPSNVVTMPTKATKQGGDASEAQRKFIHVLKKQTQSDDNIIADLTGGTSLEKLSGQQARKVIEDLLAIKNGTAVLTYDADGKATVTHQ
jgi:hypothetical protein